MSVSTSTGTVVDLGHPWRGVGPFIFAVHHLDAYPRGNADMGPAQGISDRPIGQDFGNPSGWNMYHGEQVPGFPAHPHRGFETITLVRRGVVDHADSTGATARFGGGDVQWVTAGKGVSHSEMFPLLEQDADNPFELYQIWLNLPARSKGVDPEFLMLWHEDIPVVEQDGARVTVVAGTYDGRAPLSPPVASWATDPTSDVAVWLVDLEPGASITLPATGAAETQRMLYVHGDGPVEIDGVAVASGSGFAPGSGAAPTITAGDLPSVVLVLQGVDLGEPVASYGPFVMNTQAEIVQAFEDYQRTEFGGWGWESRSPVHPRETPRFATYGDGRTEHPGDQAS
ncbi:pirin [Janibacter sp. Soil728]|uniref:pirin family protein n=1 Tax=Janibacter sp. Soil728 TaxID=1736393 RepID=UPI0007012CC6|nr:pirin family protein [Janibacter sp. Soil728]KRE38416.1 pirin [Janibacter sp. Soil728]